MYIYIYIVNRSWLPLGPARPLCSGQRCPAALTGVGITYSYIYIYIYVYIYICIYIYIQMPKIRNQVYFKKMCHFLNFEKPIYIYIHI